MPTDETGEVTEPEPVVAVRGLGLSFVPRPSLLGRLRRRPAPPITVAQDVSFTVPPGEAVGCLAAAGAGRSALVRLLTGETAPTSGTVRICGLDPATDREQLAHRIGLVSGNSAQLWSDLSLDESLQILARAHRLTEAHRQDRRDELVTRLDLGRFIKRPVGRLSGSQRIRGELAAALLHEPDLLILDQPTLGLDVLSKEQLRTFLRQENRVHGRTLVLATGDLLEVEQICHRVLVVDQGRLVHDGDLPGLLRRAGAQRTLVVDLIEADRRLDDVPGTKLIEVEEGGLRQRLHFTPGSIPATRVLADVAARSGIRHLALEEPDLEELIRRL